MIEYEFDTGSGIAGEMIGGRKGETEEEQGG